MKYFNKVKLQDKVYSLVYGQGRVIFVLPKNTRLDGSFMMQVEFMDGTKVYYTEDGIPNWCSDDGCGKTLYYFNELDLTLIDFEPVCDILTLKQIMKYEDKETLQMRCPSGVWRNAMECPEKMVQKALKKLKYHLFRKEPKN